MYQWTPLFAARYSQGIWKDEQGPGYHGWVDISSGLPGLQTVAMVYNPVRKTLYAGVQGFGVWEYDGVAWTSITAGGPLAESAISALAYDPTHKVLYASASAGVGVWEYASNSWVNIGGPSYFPYDLAYDDVHGILYTAGGGDGSGQHVWKYDVASATWADTGAGPVDTWTLAYDPTHNLLYAATLTIHSSPPSWGLWYWDGVNWHPPTTGMWLWNHIAGMVYGANHGLLYTAAYEQGSVHDDVYSWDGASWHDLNLVPGLGYALGIQCLAYDPAYDLLYAGSSDFWGTARGIFVYDNASWRSVGLTWYSINTMCVATVIPKPAMKGGMLKEQVCVGMLG